MGILINISIMSFAWCFMYATMWWVAYCGIAKGDQAVVQIYLATLCSVFGFVFIQVLDYLADKLDQCADNMKDKDSTDPMAETLKKVPRKVIGCVGFLVGFCWEAAFDKAIEGVTEQVHEEYRIYVTCAIAIGSVAT